MSFKKLFSIKLKLVLGMAVASLWVTNVQAQDAENLPEGIEVIKKSVEAMGGAAKFKALKSMKGEGSISIPVANIEGEMDTLHVYPNLMVTNVDLGAQAGQSKEGISGKVAWEMSSMQGDRVLSEKETLARLETMDQSSSYDPASFYKSAKTVGIEEVGKEKCFKVKVETKNGNKEVHFYSLKTGLPTRKVATMESPNGAIEVTSEPKDFKDINGIMTPHRVVQSMMGMNIELKFDKIEYNVEIDKSKFELPPKIKKIAEKMEARKKEKAAKEKAEAESKEKVPATSDK